MNAEGNMTTTNGKDERQKYEMRKQNIQNEQKRKKQKCLEMK